MNRSPSVSLSGGRAASPEQLLALVVLTLVFVVWAVWTVLPAAPAPAYINGTFGASTQADYKTDLDRRLAPQRAVTRG
jgi:hypothetical protein